MLRIQRVSRCLAVSVAAIAYVYFARTSLMAEQPASAPESRSTDVVVLSLTALDDRGAEHRKHVRDELGVNSGMDVGFDDLFSAQMEIARKAALFGPVLLIAPDETTKSLVYRNCKRFQVCDLFRFDRIRMKVVPHDSAWVRDFGPQIEIVAGKARVVHWRYFDNRGEEAREETIERLDAKLARLFEYKATVLSGDADGPIGEMTEESEEQLVRELDSKISFLRDYSQFLRESSIQRVGDETSAYDFADAVLQDPHFKYVTSKAAVDGGNLLKLADGRCLTIRVLLSRNKDAQIDVYRELRNVGGCTDVIFLDPLPGPVIEHVDMFALPAGGKRILLASYDLADRSATDYWGKLSDPEKYLALNAALAMDRNAARLTQLGYEVIKVQSPFPRIPNNDEPYYPTVLNALVRYGKDGSRQLLLPAYAKYEEDIQVRARDVIRAAFGPGTEIDTVESTATAQAQGAIHCLTLTVPLSLSIFNDPGEKTRRARYFALKENLDSTQIQQVAEQIPPTGEQGLWVVLEENEQPDADAAKAALQEIHFAENEFQVGTSNHIVVPGQYEIQKPAANKWLLLLKYPDGDAGDAILQWEGRNLAKLTFRDTGKTVLLMRLNDEAAVPFEPGEERQQVTESSANRTPSNSHLRHQTKQVAPKQTERAASSTP